MTAAHTGPQHLFAVAKAYDYQLGRDRCAVCACQLGPNKPAVFVVSSALGVIRVFCETCAPFATNRGWKPAPPTPP